MTNEVTAPKNFDDRMLELFREKVGSMLTDGEINKIVETGMEKLFFTERRDPNSSTYHPRTLPCLAQTIVDDLVKEQAEAVILKWMHENKERMFAIMEKQLSNENLQNIMLQMFGQMFVGPITLANNSLQHKITNFAFQNNLNPGALHD